MQILLYQSEQFLLLLRLNSVPYGSLLSLATKCIHYLPLGLLVAPWFLRPPKLQLIRVQASQVTVSTALLSPKCIKYFGLDQLPAAASSAAPEPVSSTVWKSTVLSGGGSSGSSWFASCKYLHFVVVVLYSVTFIRLWIPVVPLLSL